MGFSCLATLQLSDCHPYFISGQCATLYISRSSAAGKMSDGFCGAGLLSNSSKCSTHLFLCCSSPTICLLVLSFTSLSGFPNFPAASWWCHTDLSYSPSLAACSAASASPSMYFLLSGSDALTGQVNQILSSIF